MHHFPVRLSRLRDGYLAVCPEIRGVHARGDSRAEAMGHLRKEMRRVIGLDKKTPLILLPPGVQRGSRPLKAK